MIKKEPAAGFSDPLIRDFVSNACRQTHRAALLIQPQSPALLVIDGNCLKLPLARGHTSATRLWPAEQTPLCRQPAPLRVRTSLRTAPLSAKRHRGDLTKKAASLRLDRPRPEVPFQVQATHHLTATSQSPTSHSMRTSVGRQARGRTPSLLKLPWPLVWVGPTP